MNTPASTTTRIERNAAGTDGERLVPLFPPDLTTELRGRWDTIQRGFVDDPALAVRQADELVAQVIKGLAQSFSGDRRGSGDEAERDGGANTEAHRIALRRYRSFFERLLSL